MNLYRVYIQVPADVSLQEVINAGLSVLGYGLDDELVINYLGAHDG